MYLESAATTLSHDPIDESKLPCHLRLKDDTELDHYLSDISWLWPDYIPNRFVTALIAEPGMGKSAVALDICRTLLNGGNWPDGTPCEPLPEDARLLWLDMDGTLPVFRHRTLTWGMPRGRFIFPFFPLEHLQIDNEENWNWVEAVCYQKTPALVVIDSLTGAHNGGESNSTMRTLMQTLTTLADRARIAILVIHHLNKTHAAAANHPISVHRARGASVITQFCNSVIAIAASHRAEEEPGPDDEYRFDVIKSNLAPKPPPLAFTLSSQGPTWCQPKSKPVSSQAALEKAMEFIREKLGNGSLPVKDLEKAALENGINLRTLERARDRVGVRSIRQPIGWFVELLVKDTKSLPADEEEEEKQEDETTPDAPSPSAPTKEELESNRPLYLQFPENRTGNSSSTRWTKQKTSQK